MPQFYTATATKDFTISGSEFRKGDNVVVAQEAPNSDQYLVGSLRKAQKVVTIGVSLVKTLVTMDRDAQGKMVKYAGQRPEQQTLPQIEPTPIKPQPTPQAPWHIDDGYYTIVFNGEDDRITLRITTVDEGKYAGSRIVGYLNGPDNEHAYQSFAFMHDGRYVVWKRFRNNERLGKALYALTQPEAAEKAGLAYAMESGNCCKCNRRLTVPASIAMGMGPSCAKKVGMAA